MVFIIASNLHQANRCGLHETSCYTMCRLIRRTRISGSKLSGRSIVFCPALMCVSQFSATLLSSNKKTKRRGNWISRACSYFLQ